MNLADKDIGRVGEDEAWRVQVESFFSCHDASLKRMIASQLGNYSPQDHEDVRGKIVLKFLERKSPGLLTKANLLSIAFNRCIDHCRIAARKRDRFTLEGIDVPDQHDAFQRIEFVEGIRLVRELLNNAIPTERKELFSGWLIICLTSLPEFQDDEVGHVMGLSAQFVVLFQTMFRDLRFPGAALENPNVWVLLRETVVGKKRLTDAVPQVRKVIAEYLALSTEPITVAELSARLGVRASTSTSRVNAVREVILAHAKDIGLEGWLKS